MDCPRPALQSPAGPCGAPSNGLVYLLQKARTRHDVTPGQTALAWLMVKLPFMVPIPGTRLIPHMQEDLGAICAKLSAADRTELEAGFVAHSVVGDRAPGHFKASHDTGTSFGTTSEGTVGKTPLPIK